MKKPTNQYVLGLLTVTPVLLIIELFMGLVFYNNIKEINAAEDKENKLELYLRANTRFVSNAESSQRAYLLTSDKHFLQKFNNYLSEIDQNNRYYTSLSDHTFDHNIALIQSRSQIKLNEMRMVLEQFHTGKSDSVLAMVKRNEEKQTLDSIRSATNTVRNKISEHIKSIKQTEVSLFSFFFLLTGMLVFFTLFVVWYTYKKLKAYTTNLEVTVADLQSANERMSQFTTMSYHELKTPLRSISGFAQLLISRYSNNSTGTEEKEFVQYITDSVKQMNDTINEMRRRYLDNPPVNRHESDPNPSDQDQDQ